MPRLRKHVVETPVGSVPVALLDSSDPAWESAEDTNAWRLMHGLPMLTIEPAGALTRHLWSVEVWAQQQSLLVGRWRRIDVSRLTEMGIPYKPSHAARERLYLSGLLFSNGRPHD